MSMVPAALPIFWHALWAAARRDGAVPHEFTQREGAMVGPSKLLRHAIHMIVLLPAHTDVVARRGGSLITSPLSRTRLGTLAKRLRIPGCAAGFASMRFPPAGMR
jgi:cytosine/adenosine deaminase-related metal-dependent hydrolase